jgi:peptidoglycan/xylan/chitin deacetylase (PgdA/CDA1 family)
MTRRTGRFGVAVVLLAGASLLGPTATAAPQASPVPGEARYCYLTFDDGPLNGTSEILAHDEMFRSSFITPNKRP